MHYLYRITNLLNNKVYIGQSDNANRRWSYHRNQALKDEPAQYINRAMKKYGVDNFVFEVIATCHTQEDANEIEVLLIQQYDSRNKEKGYNIKPGGEAWDEEMRQYIAQKIKQHYIDHPEDRERVSNQAKVMWQDPVHVAMMKSIPHPNKMKGKTLTEEQRLKIVEGVKHIKGVPRGPRSNDVKEKINNTKINKSEEEKRRITDSITVSRGQVLLSEEQKELIINDPRSSYDIAKNYGVNASTIQRVKKKAGIACKTIGRYPIWEIK